MSKFLDGEKLSKAIISGAHALANNKNRIDSLNVFPVPDGDTGTNMSSTFLATVKNLEKLNNPDVSKVAASVAHDTIYEARGNSGVILSQIWKGFALGVDKRKKLSTNDLIIAFESATQRAYKSVFKPIEGTILTVIREISENLRKNHFDQKDLEIEDLFDEIVAYARKSCDETPNKLKTLREVGVTDSGGEGLYQILWGMNEFLHGNPVSLKEEQEEITAFISDSEVYDGEFGYCTEFLIDMPNWKDFDKNKFNAELEKIANSLVIVNDDNLLKVHGHTLKPGDMLNFGQKYGEFIKIKSENMTLQANDSKATTMELADKNSPRALCGVVSCNLGNGIIRTMKELNCDYIVESGQTQNPSAQDLINAIEQVNAETVFVLPNNSNVILVAQQAAQVVTDKNVIIVPTKTQIQGITAMMNFNSEISSEDNLEQMQEAIAGVSTGEITQAVRNTKINNIKIKEEDFLCILDNKIVASEKDLFTAGRKLVDRMIKPKNEIVSIYYGDESSLTEAEELLNYINSKYDIEVEIIEGNQPNYHFYIGVE